MGSETELEEFVAERKTLTKEKKSSKFSACVSIRATIVVMITCLIVCCSVAVWLASFVSSRQALNDLTSQLMITFSESVINYMNGQIHMDENGHKYAWNGWSIFVYIDQTKNNIHEWK